MALDRLQQVNNVGSADVGEEDCARQIWRYLEKRTQRARDGALEKRGVEFLNHGQPGVRLRQRDDVNHPKPAGPATEVVKVMDAAIAKDGEKKKGTR